MSSAPGKMWQMQVEPLYYERYNRQLEKLILNYTSLNLIPVCTKLTKPAFYAAISKLYSLPRNPPS
jgi:hypothetical protein